MRQIRQIRRTDRGKLWSDRGSDGCECPRIGPMCGVRQVPAFLRAAHGAQAASSPHGHQDPSSVPKGVAVRLPVQVRDRRSRPRWADDDALAAKRMRSWRSRSRTRRAMQVSRRLSSEISRWMDESTKGQFTLFLWLFVRLARQVNLQIFNFVGQPTLQRTQHERGYGGT